MEGIGTMEKIRGVRVRIGSGLAIAAGVALLGAGTARAGDHPGRAPFEQYCASCHGVTGDGKGPVAADMKTSPADLRKLHERYGAPLDQPRLQEVIDGREMMRSHGTPDMPVWGERLIANVPPSASTTFFKRGTIAVIIDYLQTLQPK
jgi:mono/diheme cytochrome c family protein